MGKSIVIQYTDPETGAPKTKTVSIDIDRYRKDAEEGVEEGFYLKATAAGCSTAYEEITDLVVDLLDGRPSSARKGIVQAMIDTEFTANGQTLSVTPNADDAGFEADVPCVVMDKYGSVKDWFIPSAVGDDFTIPTSGGEALEVDCKVGWYVQQAKYFLSPLAVESELGIKAQCEQPESPSNVEGEGSVSEGITVTWTDSEDEVALYYDVYCYKTTKPDVIEPNAQPSAADVAAGTQTAEVTQYFDEATMELKDLDAGTYYIGVVAKDGSGQVDVNESEIEWSSAIVIE